MKNICEIIRDVIQQRILPSIERDGISNLILPEQIKPADCARPISCNRPCRRSYREEELAIGLFGEVTYCINNMRFIFTPGRIVLLPSGTPHMSDKVSHRRIRDFDYTKTSSVLWLHASAFGITMQIGCVTDNSYELTPPQIFLGRNFSRLLSRLTEEVRFRPSSYTRLGRYILLEFVERCLRVATDGEVVSTYAPEKVDLKDLPDMVRAALEFIYSHYRMSIGLDDIAEAADTSASHLIKRFKTALEQTPVAYLLKVRIATARELLATDLQVSEVARIVGIHDPAYFSRVFHRSEGISPLAYSKKVAKRAAAHTTAAKARKSRSSGRSRP
ncbi:MAG: helix-turn-helix transcriptional regulator [Phycisphaerae bacterium]|nr:helix-turn-helix transcriptional regulator [Phycisphaerae bacterium]